MFNLKSERIIVLTLFGIIGFLLLLRQCGPEVSKSKDSGLNQRKDTSWVDTIPVPYEVIKFKPIYYPKWDTFYPTDTTKWNTKQLCDITRFYNDSISDSNVTIFSNLEVIGMLTESYTSYRLKVPKLIKETREIHDTKFQPNKWSIEGNSYIGGNLTTFNMSIGASLRVKKAVIGYNYGLIDKSHNIKIGYILFNSKK